MPQALSHDGDRNASGSPAAWTASSPSDDAVLDLVVAGHHHAFDVLVNRYGGRVRSYLRHLVGDDAWVDDLTQDVLVKVFQHAADRDRSRRFPVWLFTIARNEALDFLRRQKTHRRAVDAVAHRVAEAVDVLGRRRTPTDAERSLDVEEFREHFGRALTRLPEMFRTPFLLKERHGLSYEEIATIVGSTPKTVSTRIHRARLRLRKLLAPFLEDRGEEGPGR